MSDRHTILVTGAAGFIGSHVAQALLRRGDAVVALDLFDHFYDPALKHANAQQVRDDDRHGRLAIVSGDCCDTPLLERLLDKHAVTGVVHLAARAGVRPSIADPALYARANVEGTTAVLDAARRSTTCSRVVVASSSSVYGDRAAVPFAETDPVDEPISPYAATKRACELIAHTFHHLYGTPVALLRFFTVFGPRQRPDLAIAKFLRLVAAGEPIPMYGNGATSRDYTYVDDIVAGVLAAYDRVPSFGLRTWNLGGSDPVTLDDMIRTVGRVVGREPIIEHRPAQMGDVERTYADLTRSRAELGFEPRTPFDEGVRRQWAWASAQLAAAS